MDRLETWLVKLAMEGEHFVSIEKLLRKIDEIKSTRRGVKR